MSVTQNQVDEVRGYLLGLQDSICAGIETEDGTSAFRRDTWQRPEGGGVLALLLRYFACF